MPTLALISCVDNLCSQLSQKLLNNYNRVDSSQRKLGVQYTKLQYTRLNNITTKLATREWLPRSWVILRRQLLTGAAGVAVGLCREVLVVAELVAHGFDGGGRCRLRELQEKAQHR